MKVGGCAQLLGNSTTVEASEDEPVAAQPAYIAVDNRAPRQPDDSRGWRGSSRESVMLTSTRVASRERHARMREARAAIGRLLHAEYVPMLTEPLPRELKHLIAQLVAREASREEAGEHAFEALSYFIA